MKRKDFEGHAREKHHQKTVADQQHDKLMKKVEVMKQKGWGEPDKPGKQKSISRANREKLHNKKVRNRREKQARKRNR